MTEVRVLRTARDRDAQSNLEAFVAKGKGSKAFGEVQWDASVWKDIKLVKEKRATAGRTGKKDLCFMTGRGGERGATDSVALKAPFADFVKALVRLREDRAPRHVELHRATIRACRYLHDQLSADEYDPCRLTPAHFNGAAKAARAAETQSTAYRTGVFLSEVAAKLDEYAISRVRLGWRNRIPRPSSDERFGEEAERRRATKLPSQAALDALSQIANMPLLDPDLLRMRVIELLACGGWRINELLSIPADCEVWETAYVNGEAEVDLNGQPVRRYGIRYFAEKGFGPAVKWLPTPMVDVARRAVADIRRITDPVRADARWMRDNPGRVNVPRLDGDPDAWISMTDLPGILGLWPMPGRNWVKAHRVQMTVVARADVSGTGAKQKQCVRARDVCSAYIADLPVISKGYPVRLEDHMFLIRQNFIRRRAGAISGSVRLLIDQMVGDFITGGDGRQSIFEIQGFTEADGSPIKVTTHQFRHWLNTLAQEGGMSQELIARWSGRKDMGQNAAYDHMSGRKLAEKVRGMVESERMAGPIAAVADRLPLADRTAFLGAQIATAHVTEIGLCVHDWSLAPCPTHGECVNCNEHVVDKGNDAQREEAARQLAEVEGMLALAEEEDAEGTYGAARWVEAHRRKRDGLKAVLAVHEDVGVADGMLVHMLRGPAMQGATAAAAEREATVPSRPSARTLQ